MNARDGAVSALDKFGRSLAGRARHLHAGCGHGCLCFNAKTKDCQRCQTKAFNDAMAARYREDSLSTEALLERRA